MILDNVKLEKLLLANWANILNPNEVMKFALACARDKADSFTVIEESELPKKSVQILVSQFSMIHGGFHLWIDFTVPRENEILVGTVEASLISDTLFPDRVIGNRFVVRLPQES